ncbi:hypothetical protein ABAC460_12470 [Asticcacaulis sp. AC460]|uniref:endo-beta-N-acetylglucosaminidase n=1 Tax=Asticcacaulis sp. AC460 TaxID=1282360 RepID=UPI0003C3AD37|nr:hypothetical protein [Asticcacaulis sp. AC460]ESQ89676.1 hypothetical protein ABAC460_12470 [Asticcacaulis sp. AC460]
MHSRRTFLALTASASLLPWSTLRAADAPAGLAPKYPLSGPEDAWLAFKAYDPATDPDAAHFRSRVARAERIAPFAPTQAHPALNPAVPGATLLAAYLTLSDTDIDLNRTRYAVGSPHWVHVERSWQFQDIAVGWNTTGLVPNPSLVDAAHRNGALCLGTMFQPDPRFFDGTDLPRPQVAAKLVGLAQYFGFDGYFVNFESYTDEDARAVQDLIADMQAAAKAAGLSDFHIQYYNGHTGADAVWPGSPHVDGTPRGRAEARSDSMMLDQGWSNYGLTRGCCSGRPLKAVPTLGQIAGSYDPLDVYYGFQLYPGPGYFGLMAPTVIQPNGGKALGGLQIYSVEDGLRKMRRARLDALRALPQPTEVERAEIAAFTAPASRRNAWYNLYRRFWAGQSGNPAMDNAPTPEQQAIYGPADVRKIYTDYQAPGQASDQIRLPVTYGVANFIAERSVIGALPFVSHFNTGDGDRFFVGGERVAETPWYNMGIQDVLPTWTWWTRSLDGGAVLEVDYDYVDAYDGGASLRISGAGSATEVKLYKTQIAIDGETTIGLAYKGAGLEVGLVFEDAPDTTEWLKVGKGKAVNGWRQWRQSLKGYEGRVLAAVSLGASGPASIGEFALTSEATAVAKPEGFAVTASQIDASGKSADLRLNWTFDPSVRHYDLFAVNGKARTWLGRIVNDAYFVKGLARTDGSTVLQLVPYGRDGRPGEAATTTFDWG